VTSGLVDAYRASRALGIGEPLVEATYFHHRRSDQPFHIDYVFAPASWTASGNVEVGDFDTRVGAGRSDHVPVTVEIS
jgi:endonuclease/exonuclease/phosphatase family metal-dependent hydrolase